MNQMTSPAPADLTALRSEIDRIDEAIVDLLAERMAVVDRVGRLKAGSEQPGIALRPAREASILRRLVARAEGRFPAMAIGRMWRELLAATTRAQTPFDVAVMVPEGRPAIWDVARDHFGSITPLVRVAGGQQAMRALNDGQVQLAVLPLPGEDDLWWRGLVGSLQGSGRGVIARLPFIETARADLDHAVVVIGGEQRETSGDDLTLMALEVGEKVSRARLGELLAAAGLEPHWLASVYDRAAHEAMYLVEVNGFGEDASVRVRNALTGLRSDLLRAIPVGGYARPLRIPA